MKHSMLGLSRVFVMAIGILCFIACSTSTSQEVEEILQSGSEDKLYAPWDTVSTVDAKGGEIKTQVKCQGRWTAKTDADWICLSETNGIGDAMLTMNIDHNTFAHPRTGLITVALESDGNKQYSVTVNQKSSSSLFASTGIEKGAGFGYDVKADYCMGMTYAVFDLARLDYLQRNTVGTALHFVEDDISTYSEEEYIQGETKERLKQQFSAKASVDLNAVIGNANVTGTVTKANIEEKNSVYCIKRSKNILFARDIQYANIMQYLIDTGDSSVFAPGFYADWNELESYNNKAEQPSNKMCNDFLDKWGIGFVTRSFLGGSVDYHMQIDKSVITDSLDCSLVLDATVAGGIVKADGSAGYQDILNKLKEKYSLDIYIRGGDVQQISTILFGESISMNQMKGWQQSLKYNQDSNESNVVVVDVKIASFANLFTGKVRDKMKLMIDNR